MILADTSVWIEHLRHGAHELAFALANDQVLMHPCIIGELACGNLRNRDELLHLLGQLPHARTASHEEVLAFIERRRLMGRGIGLIDAHLLASVVLTPSTRLLTLDRRLVAVAAELTLGDLSASTRDI